MSATVLPFPRVRDRGFVARHARLLTVVAPQQAEKQLRHQMRVQAETMERRGIAPELIAQQVEALECAIRCEWHRAIARGGDAA